MAKVCGLHMIALRPGVKGEDFEKFFREKVVPGVNRIGGWKTYLLKGDRGDREGKYLVMVEIESVEARDRFAPGPDQHSDEGDRFHAENGAMFDEWEELASVPGATTIYTDYVVVA